MSATTLANWIDRLPAAGCFIAETGETVSISNLSVRDARALGSRVTAEGWAFQIFDVEGEAWPLDQISADLAPFRLVLNKPTAPIGTVRILTNAGFKHWLQNDLDFNICQIGQLNQSFDTFSIRFMPWQNDGLDFTPGDATKSPRVLVREYHGNVKAPNDIRPWLLIDNSQSWFDNISFRVWMSEAVRSCLNSLPDEIDGTTSELKFKGPPRLSLSMDGDDLAGIDALGPEGFKDIQRATRWVFDNAREAEMRHVLLATEIARSGVESNDAVIYMRDHISAALDGAKIGYQASLSQLSSDTLKALADLRKAVTEETAKVTEATRQITGAVATTLALGLGLMAARVTTTASSTLIIAVMLVAVTYVSMVILSGLQFAFIQRELRKGWQPRLYRYLPVTEYTALVLTPTKRAEKALFGVAALGALATICITILVVWPTIWSSSLPTAN